MSRCDQCGNDYDKPLVIEHESRTYTFDCFECAIEKLAPACAHCGCRIIGHGTDEGGQTYCCEHCARKAA